MRRDFVGVLLFGLTVGCGSADEPPLGGPYGGTGAATSPNASAPTTGGTTDKGTGPPGSVMGTDPKPPGQTAQDSGTTTPPDPTDSMDAGPGDAALIPSSVTWSMIYAKYLATGTVGNCSGSGCHAESSTASGSYAWLTTKGYISGTSSKLTNPKTSCLSWYGGFMPDNGPASNAQATADMNAWVGSGAPNN